MRPPTPEHLEALRVAAHRLSIKIATLTEGLRVDAVITKEDALATQRCLVSLIHDASNMCLYLNRSVDR